MCIQEMTQKMLQLELQVMMIKKGQSSNLKFLEDLLAARYSISRMKVRKFSLAGLRTAMFESMTNFSRKHSVILNVKTMTNGSLSMVIMVKRVQTALGYI